MEPKEMSDAVAIRSFFGLSAAETLKELKEMKAEDKKELGELCRKELVANTT